LRLLGREVGVVVLSFSATTPGIQIFLGMPDLQYGKDVLKK